MIKVRLTMTAIALVVAVSSAQAATTSFDFEGVPFGFYNSALEVTSGSLRLVVTPEGFPDGWLNIASPSVGLLGSRSLMGTKLNLVAIGGFAPVRFSFSQPIADITFAFGDNGGDDDTPVTIQAFNSANTLLGTINDTYPFRFTAGKTVGFSSLPGASYFTLTSGVTGGSSDSVFWEVQSVTTVPEPFSVVLAIAAFAGFAARAWRRPKRWGRTTPSIRRLPHLRQGRTRPGPG